MAEITLRETKGAPLTFAEADSNFSNLNDDKQELIASRAKAGHLPIDVARIVSERNIGFDQQRGFYWSIDQSLKAASALKFSDQHNRRLLSAIECDVSVIIADQGFAKFPIIDTLKSDFDHFNWHSVSGHHHCHLDQQAKEIAQICLKKLASTLS